MCVECVDADLIVCVCVICMFVNVGKHDFRSTVHTSEYGLDDLTKKYIGGKVSKEFLCDDDGNVKKYIGEITHVGSYIL